MKLEMVSDSEMADVFAPRHRESGGRARAVVLTETEKFDRWFDKKCGQAAKKSSARCDRCGGVWGDDDKIVVYPAETPYLRLTVHYNSCTVWGDRNVSRPSLTDLGKADVKKVELVEQKIVAPSYKIAGRQPSMKMYAACPKRGEENHDWESCQLCRLAERVANALAKLGRQSYAFRGYVRTEASKELTTATIRAEYARMKKGTS